MFWCNTQHTKYTVSFVLKVSRIFNTKCVFIVPSCNVCTFAIRYIYCFIQQLDEPYIILLLTPSKGRWKSFPLKWFTFSLSDSNEEPKDWKTRYSIVRWSMNDGFFSCSSKTPNQKLNTFYNTNGWIWKIRSTEIFSFGCFFQMCLFPLELWIILITAFWLSNCNY